VIRRSTSKNADAAYTRIRVTGKDPDGVDLDPVYADVPHFGFWALGAHKTKHITAPDGFTQEQLEDYAQAIASALQYVGIGEQFAGPLRPHLLCGDVASIYYNGDTESVDLGIINEIEHTFGDQGFWTMFSVDSGGSSTDGENYVISRSVALKGFNRRQTLADLISDIAKR
jgi:hypothetical protein